MNGIGDVIGFGDAAIRIAIGIHYGDVFLGDIGSDRQLELTVLGDTANIANRVEAYCRSLDKTMLVTGAFVDALHAEGNSEIASNLMDLGRHTLRGRFNQVQLYGHQTESINLKPSPQPRAP
jgi:adenylate cyclase